MKDFSKYDLKILLRMYFCSSYFKSLSVEEQKVLDEQIFIKTFLKAFNVGLEYLLEVIDNE